MSGAAHAGTGRREPLFLLVAGVLALVWSAVAPHDRLTWWLDVSPTMLAAAILIATWRRFPLSDLACRLIFLHAIVLMIGAHYTYAKVPAGFWVQDALGLARNHYDRLGHFMQGFAPAIIVREILLRCSPLRPGKWLFAIGTVFCLAISAFYELIEWWVAIVGKAEAEAFLATQGDAWDTQWDMFMALVGALAAALLLSRAHDRALERLASRR
ncbi:MAG: hypothetical protein RL477_293 [Pseudomonadota bacterium]|jgi:putative membrane protein